MSSVSSSFRASASDDRGGMRRCFEDWLDFGQSVGGLEFDPVVRRLLSP